jgi:single-stranded-DNA-specific exonuclease
MAEVLLLPDKRWVISEPDLDRVEALRQRLGIHPVLCRLLVQRGIDDYDKAHRFFRPTLAHLHDPRLMKDMDQAVARIDAAIVRHEKILVYGDYDVDGTTAVALMYSFLKDFYPNVDYYVPNRYTEGYGVSMRGIDHAKANGFTLIIALDCGITAFDQISYAHSLGIDFIVCDHHLPTHRRPPAVAVLDPKQPDCSYPYDELSGCGIGFKLAHALCLYFDIPLERLYKYLDLVVVSIASDIVPITGENRTLAYFGLKKLNEQPLPGLRALMTVSGLRKDVAITDIVFGLGPRINAAGRMDDARHAVSLLISEGADGKEQADVLDQHNTNRKEKDENITLEALALLEAAPRDIRATVVFQPDWHKGVIGIVASRLIETYHRPTIVCTQSGDFIAGSARSVPGYNIYEAIQACSDLLEQFGGHKYAAGLSMRKENYPEFKERFQEYVSSTIDPELLIPQVRIDAELGLKDITGRFYNILRQFAPFGPSNMRPVFISSRVKAEGRIVGDQHLKLKLRQEGSASIDGIAFEMGHAEALVNSEPVDVCYSLDVNSFRGYASLQLVVRDIRKPGM